MRPDRLFRGKFFYGWVIVAVAFLANFVYPAVHFSFGTYFESVSREFNAERGSVSLVFSLAPLLYFGVGALTGPLTDRFGPRPLVAAGALFYLVGLALASRAGALWQVYLTYSLFVGCAIGFSYVPSLSTAQRWFSRRRALVAGLVAAGSGVGTFVGPAVSTWLIQQAGWRTAYLLTGIIAAILVGSAAAFLIRSPVDIGSTPDGVPEPGPSADGSLEKQQPADRPARQAIRTPIFWWLYAAQGLTTLPLYIGLAHLVPFARDAGLDPALATLGLGAIGIGSTTGRLLVGALADRFGRRRSYALTMAGTTLMMLVWLVLPAAILPALLGYGLLFGIAYGGFVALSAVVMPDYFGTRSVSTLIGLFYTAAGIGGLIGPWLAGATFDWLGVYHPAILLGAVTAGLSAVFVARLPDPPRLSSAPSPAQAPGG